jgi:DNA-directed RNA polymerase specialized sigma24 family protein
MRFLNVLVQNRLRDEARHQRAARRDSGREVSIGGRSAGDGNPLIEVSNPRAPTPSRLLMMREELQQAERAMDRLSPIQRKLLVAVLLEEKTYVELAQDGRFGETPDAVRMKFNQQFPVSKAGGADGRPASRYARDLVTLLR